MDRRLRVLTLTRDAGAGVGGTEVLVYEFARRFDRETFRSYLCTTRRPLPERTEVVAEEKSRLESDGVTVMALDRDSSWSLAPWASLYRLLRRERIDVVHSHMPRASVPGTVLARLARVPVVISHEHGSVLEGGKHVRKFLDRNVVARWSDLMLAVSESDRTNLIERERIPADRIRVFRHGIPLSQPSGDVRLQLAPAGVPLVGAVGRLFPVKGYDDLIRAVGVLKQRGRTVRCVIAGDGPDRQRLAALIAELGLAGDVELLGFRSDVPDLLRALDIAVLSSHSEGGPLAIIEYMGIGAPIVATEVGGVPEIIEDGVHGLLVRPHDPSAMAKAIERLLQDPELARRLGAQARQRQRAEFDIDITVRRLEDLYRELYARSDRA
jgi:glycosyltransferase involved in cell wall biosynthesis